MHIESDIKLGFKDVLFRPKRSTLKSRSEVDIRRTFTFRYGGEWTGVPVIAANMDTVGTFQMAEEFAKHEMLVAVHKHYSIEQWQQWLATQPETIYDHVMVSTGTSNTDMEKLTALIQAEPKLRFICIDVANGYQQAFVDFVREARGQFPNHVIVAGNVVTGEMVEELILSGADIVKVGIGPGSVCTTRVKTGVGYPQLSAVIESADAAHGLGGQIVSDGGCSCAGDVSKAFGAGADFVMIGGMFAGHDESGGEREEINGKTMVKFYGMSSDTAMNKHNGGVANYRASEGKTVLLPYRGPVENTILDVLGGVRSTCTYVGAAKLKELSKRTTFIRVQEQENRIFG
ncbi:GMP reductase [Ferrimonas lipolytica]|uniref:GMP reductase n=1 Tax=Ferrimonas lipolytica TaxID=2724191 RepID=A0A6H1UK81_9GAMM|nr:GMP reductase [Ferrimonas lipolytica]QIZ78212.1 GMP reductase [Ferrimonas lipolytica]